MKIGFSMDAIFYIDDHWWIKMDHIPIQNWLMPSLSMQNWTCKILENVNLVKVGGIHNLPNTHFFWDLEIHWINGYLIIVSLRTTVASCWAGMAVGTAPLCSFHFGWPCNGGLQVSGTKTGELGSDGLQRDKSMGNLWIIYGSSMDKYMDHLWIIYG